MERGAWWATVHGVTKSWRRLSDLTLALLQLAGTPRKDLILLPGPVIFVTLFKKTYPDHKLTRPTGFIFEVPQDSMCVSALKAAA